MATSLWKGFLKSLSRPAAPRRPERVRLAVESLETRLVPTVFFGVDGAGILQISTNNGDDVTIDHTITSFGPTTLVNQQPFPDFHFSSIHIQGGFNKVNILATSKPLTADDNNFFEVGSVDSSTRTGTMQNILAPLSLGTASVVKLDDTADPTGRNITLNVVNNVAQVTNMAPVPISVAVQEGFLNLDVLGIFELRGGRGHNTFNVLDTPAAFLAGVNVTETDIQTGTSGDFVNVLGTHSGNLLIQGQARDVVTIGNGNLDNIQSQVIITNPPSFTQLVVNGINASRFQNVTMGLRFDDIFGSIGFIDGLAPQEIDYAVTDVSSVAVIGGNQGSTFTVQNTFASSAFRATEIDPGLGNNTINVLGTTGPLFIASQGARDLVSVGGAFGTAGTLTHIHGEVDVSNDGGQLTRLNVNASGDNFDHNVTLQGNNFQGSIFGLSQAPITYFADSVSSLNISGGSGSNANDQFFVQSTAGAPQGIQLNGGSGSDFFNIGSPSNSLDGIRSVVVVEGGVGGHNTLFVQDEGAALGHNYQTPPNEIFRSGGGTPPVTILFNNHFQNVQLFRNGQPGPQAQDLALTERVRVGQQATLTGQLVDDDPNQVLSLTVDWGDGSDPETSTPDRDPFEVTHTYASPGRYFVHVTWSDSDGVTNSRDLLIRVKPDRTGAEAGLGASADAEVATALDAAFALLGTDKDHHGWM
jgi:hypothetical protein